MCGIIGFFNKKATNNSHWDANVIFETIMHFRRKGTDGIGMLVITDTNWFIHKVHQTQAEFILSFGERLNEIINDPATRAIIVHNRWATHGNVDVNGCHPFEGERYILMHNGSIKPEQIKKVKGYEYLCGSDSERIAALLNADTKKDAATHIKSVIKSVYEIPRKIGILVIYDKEDDYLYVFRTNEREFVFAHTAQKCITRFWNDAELSSRYVLKNKKIIGHGTMLKIDPNDGEIIDVYKNIVQPTSNFVYKYDAKKGYRTASLVTDTLPVYGETPRATNGGGTLATFETVPTSTYSPTYASSQGLYDSDELYAANYDAVKWNKKSQGKQKDKKRKERTSNGENRCMSFSELREKFRSNYDDAPDDPHGTQPDPDERNKEVSHDITVPQHRIH